MNSIQDRSVAISNTVLKQFFIFFRALELFVFVVKIWKKERDKYEIGTQIVSENKEKLFLLSYIYVYYWTCPNAGKNLNSSIKYKKKTILVKALSVYSC